ncbi:MAG: hypothetical protein Fur0025_01640 [Oscillatoriaceae cyanobacterium]
MDIPQILQFVDEAVSTKTGKHLNDLEQRIIEGILQRQKYGEVAGNNGYSNNHVKKASHELLQMLSDIFGEKVKKSNLESVLERQINLRIAGNKTGKNSPNILGIGCITNCPQPSPVTQDKSQPATPDWQESSNNQINIETLHKLRQFGLSEEQIAEALDLPLEVVKQI